MAVTETPVATAGAPVESPTARDGLDEAARRGLGRDRRRAWLLVLLGFVVAGPFTVLISRQAWTFEPGHGDLGTVVARHHGAFDSVTVSYEWRGVTHRSVVHVTDAHPYCLVDSSRTDCTAYPAVIVDPNDPGHATFEGALDFSPVTQIVWIISCLLLLATPALWVTGGVRIVKTSRRRRIVAAHPWRLYAFQVRGNRERARRRLPTNLYEVSSGDGDWRWLTFIGNPSKHVVPLLDAEDLEIAGDLGGGRVVARAAGSTELLTARLAPPGASAVGRVAYGKEAAPRERSSLPAPTLVLSGSQGDFDVLGARGQSVGGVAWRGEYAIHDHDGQLAVVVKPSGNRYAAFDSRGSELTTLVGKGDRMTFESRAETGTEDRATSAVRVDVYRPLRGWSAALQVLFVAWIGFLALALAGSIRERAMLGHAGPAWFRADLERVNGMTGWGLLLFALTAPVFIGWFDRAYRNLAVLESPGRRRVRWAVWGWFVPGANLVVPPQLATELARGPRVGTDPAPRAGAERLVVAWWCTWLVGALGGLIAWHGYSARYDQNVATALHLYPRSSDLGRFVFDVSHAVLMLVAAVLALLLVRRVSARLSDAHRARLETEDSVWMPLSPRQRPTCWALRDSDGHDLARVARLDWRYVIEIPGGDDDLSSTLAAQALLVAIANPRPESKG